MHIDLLSLDCRYGVWKNRWRILKSVPLNQPDRVRELLVALIYVHNFIENAKDLWLEADDEPDDIPDDAPEPVEPAAMNDADAGRARRQRMVRDLFS